jgi:heme exporter protein D
MSKIKVNGVEYDYTALVVALAALPSEDLIQSLVARDRAQVEQIKRLEERNKRLEEARRQDAAASAKEIHGLRNRISNAETNLAYQIEKVRGLRATMQSEINRQVSAAVLALSKDPQS